MKKLVILTSLSSVLLSSCLTQKQSPYVDDVYANPKEVKAEEARLAAIAKQEQEAREKRYNDSIAAVKQAQKEKDDANPYYKDREFKYDDYYDYEYATRIRRFDRRIDGLSYYDNYYTNSYWYTGNPYHYGISIYNGYSWWGPTYTSYCYAPAVTFYNSWGWSSYPYYGYYGYNPYYSSYSSYWAGYHHGYNNGFFNGWNGYPYYGYGYGSPYYGYGGWNNPYNNGWGYYNSYDLNSSYSYGPRTSHGGGNARRASNPGMSNQDDSYYQKYINSVSEQQSRNNKFTEIKQLRQELNVPVRGGDNNSNGNTGGVKPVRGTNNPVKPNINNQEYTTPDKNPRGNQQSNPGNNQGGGSTPTQQQPPVRDPKPNKNNNFNSGYDTPIKGGNNGGGSYTPSAPSNGGGNGGGRSVPSGGGGHRPR